MGPAAGLRVRGGDTLLGYVFGYSETSVQQTLVNYLAPGSVFYDIGANVGFFSVLGCRLVGPTGQVHCFEPIAENVALLRRNGQVATRIELLKEVWGYDDSVMSRTVDTHVAELRR